MIIISVTILSSIELFGLNGCFISLLNQFFVCLFLLFICFFVVVVFSTERLKILHCLKLTHIFVEIIDGVH